MVRVLPGRLPSSRATRLCRSGRSPSSSLVDALFGEVRLHHARGLGLVAVGGVDAEQRGEQLEDLVLERLPLVSVQTVVVHGLLPKGVERRTSAAMIAVCTSRGEFRRLGTAGPAGPHRPSRPAQQPRLRRLALHAEQVGHAARVLHAPVLVVVVEEHVDAGRLRREFAHLGHPLLELAVAVEVLEAVGRGAGPALPGAGVAAVEADHPEGRRAALSGGVLLGNPCGSSTAT